MKGQMKVRGVREVHGIPAAPDLAAAVAALGLVPGEDTFVLLDGAGWGASLLAFEPEAHLLVDGDSSPFEEVRNLLGSERDLAHPLEGGPALFGYLSYEAARHLERLPALAADDLELPTAQFILPRYVVGVSEGRAWVSAPPGEDPSAVVRAVCGAKAISGEPHRRSVVARSSMGREGYVRAVERVREYVRAGDVYQANISQRFEVPFSGDALTLYAALREINPSPFSGILSFPGFAAVSSSPERLVDLRGRRASTRPIAGTYPREAARDAGPELLLDPKERAEHAMIVDLERNDLGRSSAYGSVRVEELMTTETYSHVIHIVSEITSELAQGRDAMDLLSGMFPGGTITGCPKVRCMEIIEELEPVRRALYTGSFGYLGLGGDTMDMNIAIRTIVLKDGTAYAQAGGGIVADSVPEREHRESLAKAAALLKCLGASPP